MSGFLTVLRAKSFCVLLCLTSVHMPSLPELRVFRGSYCSRRRLLVPDTTSWSKSLFGTAGSVVVLTLLSSGGWLVSAMSLFWNSMTPVRASCLVVESSILGSEMFLKSLADPLPDSVISRYGSGGSSVGKTGDGLGLKMLTCGSMSPVLLFGMSSNFSDRSPGTSRETGCGAENGGMLARLGHQASRIRFSGLAY